MFEVQAQVKVLILDLGLGAVTGFKGLGTKGVDGLA